MSKVQVDKVVNLSDDGAPQLTYGAELPVGYGLTGAGGLNITGVVTAASAVFSGNVTIGGTLTYEDVTNIDVVGVSTFAGRMNVNSSALFNEGLSVTAGVTTIAGTSTFAKATTVNATLTASEGIHVSAGVATFAGAVSTGALTVTGATNVNSGHVNVDAGYSFQWDDSYERIEQSDGNIEFFTNNSEKMRLAGSNLGIGITNPTEKFEVSGGNIGIVGGSSYKIDTHPLLTYAAFSLNTGNYACRVGSTGSSTIRHTQIYGGGSHIATFDGVKTRLGVGVTNPEGSITVARNEASGYIASFRSTHSSNSAQIIIDSPTDNNTRPSSIDLANAGTIYWSLGQAYSSHTAKAFHIATSKLQTNDTGAKLTISVGGDVGIGTFSPGRKLHLHEASSGQILQQITNDTTGVGSGDGFQIGLNSSEEVLIQNKENTKMTLYTNDNARITIANDGHCVFSNSIALGGETATANRLDDYEQGTFTPVLSYTSGASGVTYSAQQGRYTKIGDTCFFQLRINLTDKGTSSGGNVQFSGLPFTPSTNIITNSMVNFDAVQGVNASDDGLMPFCQVQNGNLVAYWHDYGGSGGYQELNHGNLSDNAQIAVSGEFRVGDA